MQSVEEVMAALEEKGSEQTRKTFRRHGAPESMYGVKVHDLKSIAKKIKGNQSLATALYRTGNSDAMYLAGLVADGSEMSKRELQEWAKQANWSMISEYTVPWVAAESPYARELALKWIDDKKPLVACCGWNTYAGIVSMVPDQDLDLHEITSLLHRIESTLATSPNRVRYTMNGFVISVGSYVQPLLEIAKGFAKKIGTVQVDVGDTACKVPNALESIEKVEAAGRIGKKRKTMKC